MRKYFTSCTIGSLAIVVSMSVVASGCLLWWHDDPDGPSTPSDPVAHYMFDGNVIDSSGNGYDGVAHFVEPTRDRFGNESEALLFDGQRSYVSVPNYPGLLLTGSMTITAWARGTTCDECNRSLAGIVAKGNIVPFGLNVDDGDRMLFRVVSGGVWWDVYAYDQSIKVEEWYHYAGVFEPNEYVRLYLDGILVAEVRDNVPEFIDASSLNTWIGTRAHSAQPSVPLFFFQGAIDDVRIYDRALRAREVRALSDDR